MIIHRVIIVVSCLLLIGFPACAQDLGNVVGNTSFRATKVVVKDLKKDKASPEVAAKGAKEPPVTSLTASPLVPPTPSPVSIKQITANLPTTWPTYIPREELELTIEIRSPECPPLQNLAQTPPTTETPRPIARDTLEPTKEPSLSPTLKPFLRQTVRPTPHLTVKPTIHPTTNRSAVKPSSAHPSNQPSKKPTIQPADQSFRTEVTFLRGALVKDIARFGFKVSKGITVR